VRLCAVVVIYAAEPSASASRPSITLVEHMESPRARGTKRKAEPSSGLRKMRKADAPAVPRRPRTVIDNDACERAIRADPNHGRCLITNEEDAQPFHVLARATPDAQVSEPTEVPHMRANVLVQIRSLEKAWGYDRNTLHADARHNVLFRTCIEQFSLMFADELKVNDTMRDLLENDQIMLVPDFETLKTLNEHYMSLLDTPQKNILEVSKPLSHEELLTLTQTAFSCTG
jgi:hypothetical protein